MDFQINQKPADIDTQILPFVVSSATDDLTDVGVTRSLDLQNVFEQAQLPATTRNKAAINVNENNTFTVVSNGQQVADGILQVETTVSNERGIVSFLCNVFGGNADLISSLLSKTLRDLPLGTDFWTDTNIVNSFTGTVDTFKGTFTPVLYGTNPENETFFNASRVRYHVYLDKVIRGVAELLGVSLVSTFFDTCPIWRKAVNVFGVGWSMQRVNIQNYTGSLTAAPAISLQVNITGEGGTFIVNVNIPSTGSADLDHIQVTTSEGYDEDFTYTPGTPLVFSVTVFVDTGGWFKVEGHKNTGHSTTNLPLGTSLNLLMQGGGIGVIGGEFYVASCLHGRPVSEWLKGIFQMFNLVSHYNPILKVWTVEPRFAYTVEGVSYAGFYDKESAKTAATIPADVSEVTRQYITKYGSVLFSYKDNTVIKNVLEGENRATFKANSALATLNNITERKAVESAFYSDAIVVTSPFSYRGLLCVLPTDGGFSLGDDKEIPLATYESEPICAFVPTGTYSPTYINYGDSVTEYVVPLLAQSNNKFINMSWSLSFNDVAYRQAAVDYVSSGLVSIFYTKWLSSMKRFELLQLKCNLKNITARTVFSSVYQFEGQNYLLNNISDFNLDTPELCEVEFWKVSPEYAADDFIQHNAVVPNLSV